MKHRHSIIAIILLVAMVLSLSACGSAPLNDEAFIKNVQKGLEARWKLTDKEPEQFSSATEFKQTYTGYVNAELSAIGDINAYTFEDDQLKELAEIYVNALNSQLEGIKYYGSDDNKYTQMWSTDGYYQRARVLCKLVDNYGLTVSKNYESALDELATNGRVMLELDDQVQAMDNIITGDIVLESLGGTNYECIITNDSKYDLSGAQIELNLYNDKNVLVDNATAYLNSWKAGSTNQCSFYIKNEFTRAEVRIALYNNSIYDYLTTEYHPIEYVNNMIINITLKTSLPTEISYTSYRTVTTRCKVTSFDFEVGYWNDGKASVTLSISGNKTYDEKGDSYSRGAKVGWKLYDSKGNVIDSGTFTSSNIKVGETFTDASSYVNKLAPGDYTLEILNVG